MKQEPNRVNDQLKLSRLEARNWSKSWFSLELMYMKSMVSVHLCFLATALPPWVRNSSISHHTLGAHIWFSLDDNATIVLATITL